LFLVGLFSELEAMLQRPLAETLDEIGFAPDLAGVLRGSDCALARPLLCAKAWERGNWDAIDELVQSTPSRGDGLPEAYADALVWLRESHSLSASR
jgi:EAL and modified HD-GYP domain-containing signal transduction protein